MTPSEYTAATAAEVRAELGRQRKTQGELAEALGITTATAGRRLDGSVPFDVLELATVAEWLDVDPLRLMPAVRTEAVSA